MALRKNPYGKGFRYPFSLCLLAPKGQAKTGRPGVGTNGLLGRSGKKVDKSLKKRVKTGYKAKNAWMHLWRALGIKSPPS